MDLLPVVKQNVKQLHVVLVIPFVLIIVVHFGLILHMFLLELKMVGKDMLVKMHGTLELMQLLEVLVTLDGLVTNVLFLQVEVQLSQITCELILVSVLMHLVFPHLTCLQMVVH